MEREHYSHRLTPPCPSDKSAGFTVLELLIVISIIGLVAALLLPAVNGARESARQMLCSNHLREIGLAIQNHHDRYRRLPAAWEPARKDAQFAYGWASELLPEIEQPGLHGLLSPVIRPPHLTSLAEAERYSLPLLLCPSDIADTTFALRKETHHSVSPPSAGRWIGNDQADALVYLPATNYVGVYGTVEADDFEDNDGPVGSSFGDGSLIETKRVGFADLQRGLSQTMLVGERKMATVPSTWLGIDLRGEDAPCRVAGSAITAPNCETCDECEFSSRHPGGSSFLWADGHVTTVNDSIDVRLYRESSRRLLFQGDE